MSQTLKSSRRADCAGNSRKGTNPERRVRQRDFTTVPTLPAAWDLMQVAIPFTKDGKGPGGRESQTEFTSLAIAERVARLQQLHGFVLPPRLCLSFPFTK